jgi:hypothetical protein
MLDELSDSQFAYEPTRELLKSILAVKDLNIRSFLFAEKIDGLPNSTIIHVFRQIYYRASVRQQPFFDIYISMVDVEKLANKLGPERMSALYRQAIDEGYHEISVLFIRPALHVTITPDEREKANWEMNEVPLGRKKSMARSQDFDLLKRLARELSPDIIGILLENPRVTEDMVIEIAARRPAAAEVQREIFSNYRWISRKSIQNALTQNPYTPPDIAIRLINLIDLKSLKDVARSDCLHPEVIAAAQGLVDLRNAGS